MNKKMKQLV